ncbi:MAG: dihydrofolate reductase [Bacteroidia bacterium]|nr:dihydrofolate reductase [Bacteroidia bacterium]
MIYPNIAIIVAIAQNFAIGRNNDLLFHLPDDLKRFKKITSGHAVIMGKKTLFSLPKGPLPNRRNIVITDVPGETFDRCETVYSIDEAVAAVRNEELAFVIGGGMIYQQFYPIAGKLFLTMAHKDFEADIFFPEINFNEWKELSRETLFDEKNNFSYSNIDLERI